MSQGKEKVSITLDRELLSGLKKEAEQKIIKLSNLIEACIRKGMMVKELEGQVKVLKERITKLKNLDKEQEM